MKSLSCFPVCIPSHTLGTSIDPIPLDPQCSTWPCQSVVFTKMTFSGRAASDTRIWFSWSYTTFLGICRNKYWLGIAQRGGSRQNSWNRVTKDVWRQSPIDHTKMEMRRRKISFLGEYTDILGTKSQQWLFWGEPVGLGSNSFPWRAQLPESRVRNCKQ